jgi:hypothetical protein
MKYQIFTGKSVRISSPAVTINPNGRIYLNQGAVGYLQACKANFVLLLWDEQSLKAGIMPTTARDKRAYRVAYGQSGAYVTVKSFLNWIGYDQSDPDLETVEAEWDDKQNVLWFDVPPERIV